ncbi:hypothetical protein ACFV06_20980 [Streptomyces sp. NPDC059618]|uniref:hypothetical protein n=1 Tax=Streptomyces sp. NPDC059618 TaxID=3346887 RepID=UPI0036A2DCAC
MGTRSGIVAAVVALAGFAAAGCGGDAHEGVVVTGTVPSTPYTGPLDLPYTAEGDGDAEQSAGAAGRALECDGAIRAGDAGDAWSKGDGGSTPEGGLKAYFAIYQPELPDRGYRVERVEGDRVLFSYDVGGRTKVAVVVAKDQPRRPGWGPETSASCDPSEFPASWTKAHGYEIWTDRDGRRVPTTVVSSSAGPEHCDWQSAHFLDLGRYGRQYARDPRGVLPAGALTGAYEARVRMPADARDTGYRYGDRRLWLTPDRATAYVRTSDGVEAWPSTASPFGCR